MTPSYRIEILDKNLKPITSLRILVVIDTSGHYLSYNDSLSDVGSARFRVGTKDPNLLAFGDIFNPYANHVRIYRGTALAWSGVVIGCPSRNQKYVEVKAVTYLYLFTKYLIRHDPSDGNGSENYRTLKSGTLANAVTTFINEMKADVGANHPLANLQIGTIENPSFPANFTDQNGASIAGQPWTFSDIFQLKFDYKDLLYVIGSLGIYAQYDFQIVPTIDPATNNTILTFNFKSYIGNKNSNVAFNYGATGSIVDYDAPRDGERMANDLVGVSADQNYNTITLDVPDSVSIAKYGRVQGVAGFQDAKNTDALRARLLQQLTLFSTPDAEVSVVLGVNAQTIGGYGLGDLVTIDIKDHIINISEKRRIVGITAQIHETGYESISLTTNQPRVTS